MGQAELFYDSIYDAISNAVQAAGGFKIVAGKLWPTKKQETAYARLKSCVNEHKDEKLDPEEVLAIARLAKEQGNHALMRYLGQELGYGIEVLEPEGELAVLLREYIASKKSGEQRDRKLEAAIDRLLGADLKLRSVR